MANLRSVSNSQYSMKWDAQKNSCEFRHKNGKGGPTGCGVCDSASVFSGEGKIFLLAVNYPHRYACLEAYSSGDGPDSIVVAEPGDIDKLFGDDFASVAPKQIASRLAKEL